MKYKDVTWKGLGELFQAKVEEKLIKLNKDIEKQDPEDPDGSFNIVFMNGRVQGIGETVDLLISCIKELSKKESPVDGARSSTG